MKKIFLCIIILVMIGLMICISMSIYRLNVYTIEKVDKLLEIGKQIKSNNYYYEINRIDVAEDGENTKESIVSFWNNYEAFERAVIKGDFEKAFSSIRGAYPMINKQFVLHELGDYRFINREDDVGHDNLRKAKGSYHPALFVEKYETRIN